MGKNTFKVVFTSSSSFVATSVALIDTLPVSTIDSVDLIHFLLLFSCKNFVISAETIIAMKVLLEYCLHDGDM